MVRKTIRRDDLTDSVEDLVEGRFGLSREPEEGVGFFLGDVSLDETDSTLLLFEFKEFLTKKRGERSHEDKRG